MPQETLWNMSTTVRNPERLPQFLEVAALLENQVWDKPCQRKFQVLLIQHRKYLSENESAQTFAGLSSEQITLLKDKSIDMTYEQAESIFLAKNYQDPPMRGRQSMNPLVKLGMINIDDNKIIHLTDVGRKLNSGEITWEEFVLDSLLKYQLPNPITEGYSTWNIKPFIGILHLIKQVNQLCADRGQTVKGISTEEFGIFGLSLSNYENIYQVANDLLEYRSGLESINASNYANNRAYEVACDQFTTTFINEYLAGFNNPIHNAHEYGDSMKRYLRQTKYIFFRGKYAHQYIDLEPRRMIEINAILENDDASCCEYTKETWEVYMGTYGSYELPFETIDSLTKIYKSILVDVRILENKLGKQAYEITIPTRKEELKNAIEALREYRIELLNLEIKFDYSQDLSKIDKAITMLNDLANNRKNDDMVNKPSVELEKWTNIALNIINDAEFIKPNSPVGDDNEPTFTAPAGVPDIECDYGTFSAICEVTMLKGRDQWFNEGQPVMRHLRSFEERSQNPAYCLFVAPSIHEDTLETYWTSVKIAYKGAKQRIIPITIKQLSDILLVVKQLKENGRNINRGDMMSLYNMCIDLERIDNSEHWPLFINNQLDSWKSNLLNAA